MLSATQHLGQGRCSVDLNTLLSSSPIFRDVQRRIGDVDLFVRAYVTVRSISTLFGLQEALCHEFKVTRFEDLHLGPIVAQPFVQELCFFLTHI